MKIYQLYRDIIFLSHNVHTQKVFQSPRPFQQCRLHFAPEKNYPGVNLLRKQKMVQQQSSSRNWPRSTTWSSCHPYWKETEIVEIHWPTPQVHTQNEKYFKLSFSFMDNVQSSLVCVSTLILISLCLIPN